MFEAKSGSGSLIYSSIDLFSPESDVIETKALKNSLLKYMNGDSFMPTEEIPVDFIHQLTPGIKSATHSSAIDIYE